MSEPPSTETGAIDQALNGKESVPQESAKDETKAPVGDDEGEESDTYDDFENEEEQEEDGYEDDENEGEDEGKPNKASLTALLLENPNVLDADDAEEDDDDEVAEGEDEDYIDDGDEAEIQKAPAVESKSSTNGKKRPIDDVHDLEGGDEGGETKKVKA